VNAYTGIDIVEIARVSEAARRGGIRFLGRVYTESEITLCREHPARLASHFAGKEATMKALGMGMFRIDWRDIEVRYEPSGRPVLFLKGTAERRAGELGIKSLAISLSDSKDYAVASVVALA